MGPILFDGNTIRINAGMSVEGWNLRMGLYNGANVTMNTFVKFQGDTTMWMTVDETSQLTVGGFGKGNIANNQVIKLSSAKASGIAWNVNLESTGNANNTFEYYLKGNGSVSYQAVSAANHKIKMADVTLTGGAKTVQSKTLVSFTSSSKTFTADATIKVKDSEGNVIKQYRLTSIASELSLTAEDANVGDSELVKTATGIVLYWVDGDANQIYTPSISLNFTYGTGYDLSTNDAVGLLRYAVPGTKWNNIPLSQDIQEGEGTLNEVNAVAADGSTAVAEDVTVTITGARGSYYCWNGSAPATSDPRHGYIDDGGAYLTPTITVTNIPYDNYRVIVYCATDTANGQFGYVSVNGTNFTYDDGVLTLGTSAWGATGPNGGANAIEVGGNTVVSEVFSDSTVTVVGHRLSGTARGCIAAIQIVEVNVGDIKIENGGTLELSEVPEKTARVVCNGSITVEGVSDHIVTEADLLKFDFSGVTGDVTLGANTCYKLGADRALPGGKIAFGEGSAVAITETTEEYGKGIFSVSELTGVSKVILSRIDGSSEEITVTDGVASLKSEVVVSGKACWIDYEMAFGGEKTGFENTGTSSLALQKDSGIDGSNAFTDDGMLYTYAHPYREDLTMPSTWTAVVRCTVPNYSDAAVIMFGWNDNYIGLVAGETPKTEMRLVQYKTGYDHYVTNAVMNVQDATTAQHVYIFAVENSQTLKVYCDGSVILDKELDETLTITSGFQVGSVLGGATGGIVRFAKNESPANTLSESVQKDARIDCVRLYDYSLSADQLAALSDEFPAVKLYEATVVADADTTWDALDWSNDWDGGNEYSKVLLSAEGNAAVVLPDSITAEELAFEVEPGSTLTLKGPGSLAVTRAINAVGFTLKFAGTITLATDTTFAGNFVFADDFVKAGNGAIKLANGATVGVDNPLVVTALGTYSCAEGTVVDASYDGDGVRFVPLSSAVAKVDDDYYTTLESAVGAMGQDSTLTLLAPADRTIPLNVGQTLVAGEFTNVDVAIAEGVVEGYELVTEDGVSTLVDNRTSTWTGEDESDISWNTPSNWSNGRVPKSYTVVTFNDGAKVSLNQDVRVAGVVVNDDVTIDGYACTLAVSGDVTGDGTLKLNSVRLANAANGVVTVAEAVAVEFSGESELGGGNGVSLNGQVTISGKFSVTGSNSHAINGSVVIESGVTFSLINSGSFTINGDAKVLGAYAFDVCSSVIIYMGKLTIVDGNVSIDGWKDGSLGLDATVVLAGKGAKLTDTRQIAIDIDKVSSGLDSYDVVESNGVYSLSAWPNVTFTRPVANGSITVYTEDGLELESEASVAVDTVIIVTLTPNEDYKVDEASIMMGGVDLAADDYEGDDLIDFDKDTESGEIVVEIRVTSDIDMQFTFAPDVAEATFKVETPVGTRVEVWQSEQVEPNDDGSYTVGWRGEVTIKWFAADGYVLADEPVTKEYTAESLEVETVSVPANFKVDPAVAKIGDKLYASLQAAVAAAKDGDTVIVTKSITLDARVEPNLGSGTTLTIDLGGFMIARTGTTGNGSAFDVKSGAVTIKNGRINCSQDDTAIAKDGVYAITSRAGSAVTLEGLEVWVDSECGACAYPFAGSTITIKSGFYRNMTETPYRYKTAWTGMAVNQENIDTQLLFIEGGSFTKVDPAEGDDSGEVSSFLAEGCVSYNSPTTPGIYKVGAWEARVWEKGYASLEDAVTDAGSSSSEVVLLKDVTLTERIEPSPGGSSMTINLNGHTITRTGTSGNGSAFDVKSGTVTIKNGTIDCTQDDTAIVANGVYAITARAGSAVTLEDLTVTVNSQAGACVYPFAEYMVNYWYGATVTIKSGTYKNLTDSVYQYGRFNEAGLKGMAVNQANINQQLIFIEGGTFGYIDPELGDDSWADGAGTFLKTSAPEEHYIAVPQEDGTFVVQSGTWIAKVGTVKYQTLEDAIDAAKVSGEQVMILKDQPTGMGVPLVVSEPVTVNYNGHSIYYPTVTVAGGFIIAPEQSFLGADTWIVDTISGNAPNRIVKYGYGETRTLTLDYQSGDGLVDVTTGDLVKGYAAPYSVMDGAEVTFTAAPNNTEVKRVAAGYPKLKIGEGEAATLTAVDGVYTAKVTGGNAVISVEFEDIPTTTPAEPGDISELVDSQAEAEAAAAKTEVSVPEAVAQKLSDEQETAYKALFEAKVVPVTVGETTQYAVEVVMKESVAEAIQEDVDAETADVAAAAVAAASNPTTTPEADVSTTPGLYYVVEAGSSIDGITPASCTLATGTSLKLKIPNKGTSGFYRIGVSVTPVQVPSSND